MNSSQVSTGRKDFLRGLIGVVGAWTFLVALLTALQVAGRDFGFDVWQMGENRLWMGWLMDGVGTSAANVFWKHVGRNPLLVWWYIPFTSFIFRVPSAFLILHLGTSLLLGLAAYTLVYVLTSGRGARFGLSLGILSSVFLCSMLLDDIHWTFVGILAFSLFSVASFTQFLNSGRRAGWLALSIVFWLVAIQSYSIQIGAMLAVGVISLLHGGRFLGLGEAFARLGRAALDAAPYVATLVLFVLVWKTTAPALLDNINPPTAERFVAALKYSIWNSLYYGVYRQWLAQAGWDVAAFVIPSSIVFLSMVDFVRCRRTPAQAAPITALDLMRVTVVAGCLILPTIMVESTSPEHSPGSRSIMMFQFWAPFIVLTALATVIFLLPVEGRVWSWRLASSAVGATAIMLTLSYNRVQVLATRQQRPFLQELKAIATEDRSAGREFPRHYLVRIAGAHFMGPSDNISRAHTRTQFGDLGETTYRYISTLSPYPDNVVFLPDRVQNFDPAQPATSAPYSRIGLLAWDGARMMRLAGADQATFNGLAVDWRRTEPIP